MGVSGSPSLPPGPEDELAGAGDSVQASQLRELLSCSSLETGNHVSTPSSSRNGCSSLGCIPPAGEPRQGGAPTHLSCDQSPAGSRPRGRTPRARTSVTTYQCRECGLSRCTRLPCPEGRKHGVQRVRWPPERPAELHATPTNRDDVWSIVHNQRSNRTS